MVACVTEEVLSVHHWNDTLFSFSTTRNDALRFRNGQFVMLGLDAEPRPLLRAYSVASANHEDTLEFFSIKVPDGKLTSRLQHLEVGDPVLISRKPTGSLLMDDLKSGTTLWLLATGTGLAPFLSLIKDPEIYERFERVIVVHGVRRVDDLAYRDVLEHELAEHEYLGDMISRQLHYYPTVTREDFRNRGRITDLLADDNLTADLDLPPINPNDDRFMLCGSAAMLADVSTLLDARGFAASPGIGEPGDYVIERSFVEK